MGVLVGWRCLKWGFTLYFKTDSSNSLSFPRQTDLWLQGKPSYAPITAITKWVRYTLTQGLSWADEIIDEYLLILLRHRLFFGENLNFHCLKKKIMFHNVSIALNLQSSSSKPHMCMCFIRSAFALWNRWPCDLLPCMLIWMSFEPVFSFVNDFSPFLFCVARSRHDLPNLIWKSRILYLVCVLLFELLGVFWFLPYEVLHICRLCGKCNISKWRSLSGLKTEFWFDSGYRFFTVFHKQSHGFHVRFFFHCCS